MRYSYVPHCQYSTPQTQKTHTSHTNWLLCPPPWKGITLSDFAILTETTETEKKEHKTIIVRCGMACAGYYYSYSYMWTLADSNESKTHWSPQISTHNTHSPKEAPEQHAISIKTFIEALPHRVSPSISDFRATAFCVIFCHTQTPSDPTRARSKRERDMRPKRGTGGFPLSA